MPDDVEALIGEGCVEVGLVRLEKGGESMGVEIVYVHGLGWVYVYVPAGVRCLVSGDQLRLPIMLYFVSCISHHPTSSTLRYRPARFSMAQARWTPQSFIKAPPYMAFALYSSVDQHPR
ncbi:hypothetical protein EON64_08255 [archaeon]|nr:MAG: hypothetical protein EON64_08255 [archaeon]